MTIVFLKILAQKYLNKAFLVPNLGIFCFVFCFLCEIFPLDKFEGANFKYDNIVFKFQSKNTENEVYLVPNLGIFCFATNFAARQTKGH